MYQNSHDRNRRAAGKVAYKTRLHNLYGTEETLRELQAARHEMTAATLHKAIDTALAAEGDRSLLAADREHLAAYLLAGGEAR